MTWLSNLDPTSSKSIYSDYDPTTSEGLTNLAGALLTGGQSVVIDAANGPSVYETTEKIGSGLKDGYDDISGKTAADAAIEAAETQAAAQQSGLDYLKETEAVPQALRQAGLQQLGGLAGLEGYEDYGNQQQLIDQAIASPLYSSIMGTQAAGEDALLRNASATGRLRTGGTAVDMARYNQNLEQQALLESYNQQLGGIQGLAGLQSAAPQIAQQYGQIGETNAMGQIAAAQAKQQGINNMLNFGGQMGAAFMSDERLKTNIVKTGSTSNPAISTYKWDWIPESGKSGSEVGFIAQEVEKVYPDLVITLDDGYKRINKEAIEERLNA